MHFESVSRTIKRVLFLFIYVWAVVGYVRHSEPLWPPGWPWLMPKMPPLCLIFDIYLFALWMNMQNWKDLLASVYPPVTGGRSFRLDCGRSRGLSSRPASRRRPATWPPARVSSRISAISPLSRWSSKDFSSASTIWASKIKLLMKRPGWLEVVIILNMDSLLLPLITAPAATRLLVRARAL